MTTLTIFYRGAWCPVCRAWLSDFEAAKADFDEVGVTLRAVAGEPDVDTKLQAKGITLSFDNIADPTLDIAHAYQEKGLELFLEHSDQFDHEMVQPAIAVTDENGSLKLSWSWKDLESHDVTQRPTPLSILEQIKSNIEDPASLVVENFYHG